MESPANIHASPRKIAIIGLGYVGLPLAVAFGKRSEVVGFDISASRIDALRSGRDATGEVTRSELASVHIDLTTDPAKIKGANFIIVTVPTPIDEFKRPDLRPLEAASKTVGRNLSPGSIVVFESTVYPGVTEEVCAPIIERESGLKWGEGFKVGYSPERINPGDREHALETIVKVVAGQDAETLEAVASTYEQIITAGVHRASSIKVAEAAKVIENTQRDLNIALMNELAIIFNRLGINTREVLEAAATKWNFLRFTPGLVGGHCIGVDPYYLTHKAESMGYHPQIILAGRRINDGMGKYIAETVIKKLIQHGEAVKGTRVLILGLTFKENVPDIRNTKVVDIARELEDYGVFPLIHDPLAQAEEVRSEYGFELTDLEKATDIRAIVLAVPHREYLSWSIDRFRTLYASQNASGIFIDVKSCFDRGLFEAAGMDYWSL